MYVESLKRAQVVSGNRFSGGGALKSFRSLGNSHSRANANLWLTFLAFGTVVLLPGPAFGQSNSLSARLKELNVRRQTQHYAFAGTVTDERLDLYADALEYIYCEYEKVFSEVLKEEDESDRQADKSRRKSGSWRGTRRPARREAETAGEERRTMDPLDKGDRFPVIVFNRKQDYQAFGQAFLGGSEHTIGMYVSSSRLLLILDQGNFEDTFEVLFHEAFHQFMHRYIPRPPVWIDEGLATHFGYARPTPEGLSFQRPPSIKWRLVRKLIEKRMAVPLWDVVRAGRSDFYSPLPVDVPRFENVTQSSVYYAEAYTLVHTLLMDSSGRQRLRKYLHALASDKGKNPAAITHNYFGPDVCDHVASFWVNHVNSRPENR